MRSRLFVVICGLHFFAAPPRAWAEPTIAADTQRDFTRAQDLLRQGQESLALVSFTDFRRRYPQDVRAAEAQYRIGEIYYRQRKYAESINELRKVFELKDTAEKKSALLASLLLGQAYLRSGQPGLARIEWEAVSRRAPESPEAKDAKNFLLGLDPGVGN